MVQGKAASGAGVAHAELAVHMHMLSHAMACMTRMLFTKPEQRAAKRAAPCACPTYRRQFFKSRSWAHTPRWGACNSNVWDRTAARGSFFSRTAGSTQLSADLTLATLGTMRVSLAQIPRGPLLITTVATRSPACRRRQSPACRQPVAVLGMSSDAGPVAAAAYSSVLSANKLLALDAGKVLPLWKVRNASVTEKLVSGCWPANRW